MNLISRIEPTLGPLENDYRSYFLEKDAKFSQIAVATFVVFIALLIRNDYAFFGNSEQFWRLAFCRFAIVTVGLVTILVLRRSRNIATIDTISTIFLFVIGLGVNYIDTTRPVSFGMNVFWDLVVICSMYVLFKHRLVFRLPPALVFSTLVIVNTFVQVGVQNFKISYSILLMVLAMNALGLIFSTSLNRMRRMMFKAMSESKASEKSLRESKRLMGELVSFLPDPTFAIDMDGKVVIWNKAIENMTGIKAGDMVGKGDYEYAVPFYGERRPILADLVLDRNREVEKRYVHFSNVAENTLVSESYHQNGAYIWATASPLYNSQGEIVGAVESIKDITDRKRSEEQFKALYKASKETQERYQSLLESTLDPIVTYDLEGHVTYVNNAFIENFGWTKKELIDGVPYTPDSEKEVTYRNVMKVVREGVALRDFETKRLTKGGTLVHVSISASRFNDHEGGPAGMLVILRDISERKRSEKELAEALETARQLRDEAEAANSAKSEFVANMSHEIRTPMNAIIGLTDLALRLELQPKLRDYLRKIRNSSHALLGIINDILDFSKIEAGKLELESVPFNVRDVITRASDIICANQSSQGLEFMISVDADIPDGLLGDPLRLEQILINLASNAVKFTPEGEVLLKVERADRAPDMVNLKFSVRDTGIGITKDKLFSLFNPFTQADGSTTRRFGGSGLGLTICRRLVDMMGGEILVESKPGEGSTFRFQLGFRLAGKDRPVQFPTPVDIRGTRVLIVDDNRTSREILLDMVMSFSFEGVAVDSGEKAMEALITAEMGETYDLVLLDLRMPGIDGVETARRIAGEKRLRDRMPRIIMVTAFGTDETRNAAKKVPIDGFLNKPVQPSLLFDAIMNALGKTIPRISSDARAKASETLEAESLKGTRILIAEDNEINQEVAKEILEGAGARVEIAWNGKEAVKAVHEKEFDAVLMDIQMPEMDGYEATRIIRSDARFKDLPIIAMTAHAMAGDREKCLNAGMNDHVPKPINIKHLFPTLGKWVAPKSVPLKKTAESDPPETKTTGETSWEALEGFDVEEALDRLGVVWPVLRKLLLKFRSNHCSTLEHLISALDSGDTETARRLAHSVKGMSANLGATELHVAAADLESNIKDGSSDRREVHLERFANAFDHVMRGLSSLTPPAET